MNQIYNFVANPLRPITSPIINYYYDDLNEIYKNEETQETVNKFLKGTTVGLAKNVAIAWTDDNMDVSEKIKFVVEKQYGEVKEVFNEGLTEGLKYSVKLIMEMFKIILTNPYILAGLTIVFIYFYRK